MEKKFVNEDQFVAACNQELRKHPDFEEGMEIIGVPKGYLGSDLSGYSWKGPQYMPAIVSQVVNRLKEKYELRVTAIVCIIQDNASFLFGQGLVEYR